MNRRELAKTLGLGTIASGLPKTALALSDREPQIAITIDDINLLARRLRLPEGVIVRCWTPSEHTQP
jgi:hypothetical protein